MIHGSFQWDQNILVLNSKSGGAWGAEVSVDVSFKTGAEVAIRFTAQSDHFLVTVNGKEANRFKYRLPLSDVKVAKTIPGPGEGLEMVAYSVFY